MRVDRDHVTLIVGALLSLALMGAFERIAPWAQPDRVHAEDAASAPSQGTSNAPADGTKPGVSDAAAQTLRPTPVSAVASSIPALPARALRPSEADALSAHIAAKWRIGLPEAKRIVRAASTQGQQQRLSPTLVLAIVAKESSFQHDARSRYGAHGLMQVVPRHHPEKLEGIGRAALMAPEVNITIGTRVLAEYLENGNGRLDAALVKYSGNAKAYPAKVRQLWREFEGVRKSVRVEL